MKKSFLTKLSKSGLLFFLLELLIFSILPGELIGQKQSVVLIHTEKPSGYGVAWGGPGYIVTALHIVAGRSDVLVKWGNQQSAAKVEKIYPDADLALLKLNTPLKIPQITLYSGDAPTDTDLNYWETPVNSSTFVSKTTQFENHIELIRLNPAFVKQPEAFSKSLCSVGPKTYPALRTKVFKFQEPNIEKAHSGSPITLDGQMVGMVDGGEKLVAGKPTVWAIPALQLENLLKFGVAPPSSWTPCSSNQLFGGLRSDNPLLKNDLKAAAKDMEASRSKPLQLTDEKGNALSFSLSFQGSCRDLYYTLFEEDQQYIMEMVQEGEEGQEQAVGLDQLYAKQVDIWIEKTTGASLAVPADSKLKIKRSGNQTLIEVSSPFNGLSMLVYVQKSENVQSSLDARDWFVAYLTGDGREWTVSGEDEEENYLDEKDNPFYEAVLERIVGEEDHPEAELFATITIDENNMVGVATKINDWEKVADSPQERLYMYLLEACSMLSGITFY